jgi:hypothetical protein
MKGSRKTADGATLRPGEKQLIPSEFICSDRHQKPRRAFEARFCFWDLTNKRSIGRCLLHDVHRAQTFIWRQTWTQLRYAPTREREPVNAR